MKRAPKPINEDLARCVREILLIWVRPSVRKLGEDQFNQKVVDLVESDEPLTPETRRHIADDLRRLYFPTDPTKREKRAAKRAASEQKRIEFFLFAKAKAVLQQNGM